MVINQKIQELMQTYLQHPRRPLQSEGYSGAEHLTPYQRLQNVREQLAVGRIQGRLPSGN